MKISVKKSLICSAVLLAITTTAQAMPRHLPSIYGNTAPSGFPTKFSKGWMLKVYDDSSQIHRFLGSAPLCFAWSGDNSTHERGYVYGGSNWAGRWTQEGDQVRVQMQVASNNAVKAQDAMQVELVTQVGSSSTGSKLIQTAFGHFDRWNSNPALLGSNRTVTNATLEEMAAKDSEKFCKAVLHIHYTTPINADSLDQAYVNLIKQLPTVELIK